MSEKISYDQENKIVLAQDKDGNLVSISKIDGKLVYYELENKEGVNNTNPKSLDGARDRIMFSSRFSELKFELVNILQEMNK